MFRHPLLLVLVMILPCYAQEAPEPITLELYDVQDFVTHEDPLEGWSPPTSCIYGEDFGELIEGTFRGAPGVVYQKGLLIVRRTEELHRRVRTLLERIRSQEERVVTVTVRLIESKENLRRDGEETLVSRLGAKETDDVVKLVSEKKIGSLITAPRLTLFDDQAGQAVACDMITYASGWKMIINPDGKSKTEPVRTMAKIGTSLQVQPSIGEKDVELSLDLEISATRRYPPEMRRTETPLGTVEDPEIQTLRYSLKAAVAKEESLLVGPLSKPWTGKDDPKVWLVVSCTVLEMEKK